MNRLKFPFLIFGIIFILLSSVIAAEEKVTITGAEKMEGDTDGEKIILEGELVAVKGETVIKSPTVEYNKDTKVAIFSGGVLLTQEDLKISGEEFEINFDNDRGVFRRQVRLERFETKNQQGEVEKDHIILTCSELLLDTETKDFTAKGEVVLEHEDFTATSPVLKYEDSRDKLVFSGGAGLTREKEEVWGEEIHIDLENKTFEVTGKVELTFEVEKEENKPEEDNQKEDQEKDSNEENEEEDWEIKE